MTVDQPLTIIRRDSDIELPIHEVHNSHTMTEEYLALPKNVPVDGPKTRRSLVRSIFAYPERSNRPSRSTAWLDGLRGIAATEVVLHHYHLRFLGPEYNYAYGSLPETRQWYRLPFIRNYFHSAHAMVNVFFIISGFVLTHRSLSLIRAQQHEKMFGSLSSAVFRRLLRIYLPVVPITFFGMILVRLGIKESGSGFLPIEYHASIFGQILDWYKATEKFLNPFHNYQDQWDIIHPYEHVMWTLPLEYYGSLVCYVTLLGCAKVSSTLKRSLIMLSIIYLAFQRANWWSANFLIGTLLADYILSQDERLTKLTASSQATASIVSDFLWTIVLIWSFYLCGMPDPHPDQYSLPGFDFYIAHTPQSFAQIEGGGRFWWMVAGIALTAAISQLSYARSFCEIRFCQYLGKISFMLYLIHTYVFELIGKHWLNWLNSHFATMTYIEKYKMEMPIASFAGQLVIYIGFWCVMFPVLAASSGFVTQYIDQPSIRFAKHVETYFITI